MSHNMRFIRNASGPGCTCTRRPDASIAKVLTISKPIARSQLDVPGAGISTERPTARRKTIAKSDVQTARDHTAQLHRSARSTRQSNKPGKWSPRRKFLTQTPSERQRKLEAKQSTSSAATRATTCVARTYLTHPTATSTQQFQQQSERIGQSAESQQLQQQPKRRQTNSQLKSQCRPV